MLSRTSLFALLGIGLLACGGDNPRRSSRPPFLMATGTPVCFQFAPKAAMAPAATDKPQLFVAYADIVGMPGNVKLDTRVVLFVVPAKN